MLQLAKVVPPEKLSLTETWWLLSNHCEVYRTPKFAPSYSVLLTARKYTVSWDRDSNNLAIVSAYNINRHEFLDPVSAFFSTCRADFLDLYDLF